MSQTLCDCRGPGARTHEGECAVLSEFRTIADVQARRARGELTWQQAREITMAPYLAELRAAQERRERSGDERDLPWRLQRLGVPSDALLALQRLSDDYPALPPARKFMQAPGEWCPFLTLCGPTGLGKTVAAAWVFREVARRTSPDLMTGQVEPLQWVPAAKLTRVSAFSAEDERWIREMKAARLLVLDDAGDEATGLGIATMRDVLMTRESAGKRSVLTSNLDLGSFRRRYGEALYDRLQARGVLPVLKGASLRQRRAAP